MRVEALSTQAKMPWPPRPGIGPHLTGAIPAPPHSHHAFVDEEGGVSVHLRYAQSAGGFVAEALDPSGAPSGETVALNPALTAAVQEIAALQARVAQLEGRLGRLLGVVLGPGAAP